MQFRIQFNKRQKLILSSIFLILTIPLIEQLDGNAEFNWSVFDFILAFVMLLSFGFGLECFIRKIPSIKVKIFAILVACFLFILLWAEMAAGIFNSPIAGD
jgi:hypothetical protein